MLKVEKLQFFRRHFHSMSHIDDGIIGQINGQIRIFHTLVVGIFCGGIGGLVTSEDCFGAGYQFLGVKRFSI